LIPTQTHDDAVSPPLATRQQKHPTARNNENENKTEPPPRPLPKKTQKNTTKPPNQHAGIVLTNDGHAILREIDVSHPAAKSVMQLSRAQDDECGDGTTSVVVLAGELLAAAELPLSRGVHPTVIARAYQRALADALQVADSMAFEIDPKDRAQVLRVVASCLGTKYTSRYGPLMAALALDAVECVAQDVGGGELYGEREDDAERERRASLPFQCGCFLSWFRVFCAQTTLTPKKQKPNPHKTKNPPKNKKPAIKNNPKQNQA